MKMILITVALILGSQAVYAEGVSEWQAQSQWAKLIKKVIDQGDVAQTALGEVRSLGKETVLEADVKIQAQYVSVSGQVDITGIYLPEIVAVSNELWTRQAASWMIDQTFCYLSPSGQLSSGMARQVVKGDDGTLQINNNENASLVDLESQCQDLLKSWY